MGTRLKRRRRRKNRWILLLTWPLLLSCGAESSCSSHPDFSFFMLDRGEEHLPVLTLDFSDSSGIYDLSLVARFPSGDDGSDLPLTVTFISPSGKETSEMIRLQTDAEQISGYLERFPEEDRISIKVSSRYHDLSWKYRSSICPDEKGCWKMKLSAGGQEKRLLGIGAITGRTAIEEQ